MEEGSSWTGSPSAYTRYPVSRWESGRCDAVPGEQHLAERQAEAKLCSQAGMLNGDVAWCMHLQWGSSSGEITCGVALKISHAADAATVRDAPDTPGVQSAG
jgi:hypothetical protein